MMVVGIDIAQQYRRAVDGVDDDIHLAIVEQIAKCGSARGDHDGETCSCDRRNVFKFASLAALVGYVMEKQRSFGEGGAPVVLVQLGDTRAR